MLNQHNTYVQSFMSLIELARDNAPTERYKIVIHADQRPANEHVRRYNGPSSSDVAALIPGNDNGVIGQRDILVRKRGQANSTGNEVLDKVSISHRSYDPLSCVMLFSNWHRGMASGIVIRCRRKTKEAHYLHVLQLAHVSENG